LIWVCEDDEQFQILKNVILVIFLDSDLAASLPGMGLEFGLPDHLKKEGSVT
jgi:hypothetical protein